MGKAKPRKVQATSQKKKDVKTLQATTKVAKKAKEAAASVAAARRSASAHPNDSEMGEVVPSADPMNEESQKDPVRVNDVFDANMSEGGTFPPATATEWDGESENDDTGKAKPHAASNEEEEANVNTIINGSQTTETNSQDISSPLQGQTPITPNDPNTTPRATIMTLHTGDQTPTPAPMLNPLLMDNGEMLGAQENARKPSEKGNKGKALTKDDDGLEDVQKLLVETAKAAQSGNFHLNYKFFTHPSTPNQTRKEGSSAAKLFKKPRTEWIPVMTQGLDPELLHHASNPLNMMSEDTIAECINASDGRAHKLGPSSHILVEKGFKWMFKLMSYKIPKEKQTDWITHAVRSALSNANAPLSSTLATIDLCEDTKKSPHQWSLYCFTEEGYNAFKGIRLLFDPRSEMAVLIRPWTMEAPRDPVFSIGAVVTSLDNEEEAAEARTSLEGVINSLVNGGGVEVTRTAMAIAPKSAATVRPVNVHLQIKDDVEPFFIPLANFRGLKVPTAKGTRVTTSKFGRLCTTCGSDSHVEKKRCPWESYQIGDNGINLDVLPDLTPGRTPDTKKSAPGKRKRDKDADEDEGETEKASGLPIMRDARPKMPSTKRQRTSDPKGKGKANSGDAEVVE